MALDPHQGFALDPPKAGGLWKPICLKGFRERGASWWLQHRSRPPLPKTPQVAGSKGAALSGFQGQGPWSGVRGAKPPALLLLAFLSAAAQPNSQQLQDAERARAAQVDAARVASGRAAAAAAEQQRLGAERVVAAARLRELELRTAEVSGRVEVLARRRAAAAAALAARGAALAPLLPLIERLSLYPVETLLAVPMAPDQAVRGVLVLGGITRRLEADAAAVREEQGRVAALQAELDGQLPVLAAAVAAQGAAAAALDGQIAAAAGVARAAGDAAAEASRHAAAEAARADTLRAAIAQIEIERRAAEARARAEAEAADRAKRVADAQAARVRQALLASPGPGIAASGALTAPVSGSVLRGFGEAGDAGAATGISYQAGASARVVSPCGGRVVFAAPFRSFGLLLIVDCGGGYHFVLSGFERLDAAVGQSLQAGEPVGAMPAGRAVLYVELRRDGLAVNPAPYLRAKG